MATKTQHALAYMFGLERANAEAELREALETLATCVTAGGDRWYTDEELQAYVAEELDDVFLCRDGDE